MIRLTKFELWNSLYNSTEVTQGILNLMKMLEDNMITTGMVEIRPISPDDIDIEPKFVVEPEVVVDPSRKDRCKYCVNYDEGVGNYPCSDCSCLFSSIKGCKTSYWVNDPNTPDEVIITKEEENV